MKAHVSQQKKNVVQEFEKLLNEYPIVGAVNLENLPTKQLQNMRANLRGTAALKVTKRRLMKVAIQKVKDKKKGIEQLEEHLQGMPGLIFTKENPFSLYKTLQKSKSSAPAKAGQIAPKDIIVPAGPTPFAPGPIIGELGGLGIKAGIENAKVVIKEDALVVKEGETIDAKKAEILTRLGIEPMEIGLNITAVYEDGVMYGRSVLEIDEDQFMSDLMTAITNGLGLAIEIGYPTKDTIQPMLAKAHTNAHAVALDAAIISKDTAQDLLAKGEMHAHSLQSMTS